MREILGFLIAVMIPLLLELGLDWSKSWDQLDWKVVLTAGLPPVLAILAEIFNPIYQRQVLQSARSELKQWMQEEQDRQGAARVVTLTTEGALEASGLLPTWISCTAAVVALYAEKHDPLKIAVATLVWTNVSAALGLFGVSRLNVYWLAFHVPPRPIRWIAGTWAKAISCGLVFLNAAVVAFVFHNAYCS